MIALCMLYEYSGIDTENNMDILSNSFVRMCKPFSNLAIVKFSLSPKCIVHL